MNFVFGRAYGCPEGYTPLMSACHRGRLDAAKALLRSGADPNFMNGGGDLTLFWGIDGGVELVFAMWSDAALTGRAFLSVLNAPVYWYRERPGETDADRRALVRELAMFALRGAGAGESIIEEEFGS